MTYALPYSLPATAYGPKPAAVVAVEDIDQLVARLHNPRANDWRGAVWPRREQAHNRYRIYNEDYKHLVAKRIGEVQMDADTREQMRRHISLAINPFRDVVDAVSVVYKQGVRRDLEGGSDKAKNAFRELLIESRIQQLQGIWNRYAFGLGPVMVVPVVRGEALQFDTLLPHFCEVLRNPDDPLGPPLAVAWSTDPTPNTITAPTRIVGRLATTVVLDEVAWYYFDSQGQPIVDPIEHGLGYAPVSVLRFDVPVGEDWFGCPTRDQRLYDGTLDVAVINTALQFVRRSQCKQLLAVKGNVGTMAKGQRLDPEVPLIANAKTSSEIEIETIDFDTPPDSFIKHINWIRSALIEAYGVPDWAVTFDNDKGAEGERMRVASDGLTEVRNEQIPHVREFEHSLMGNMAAVAKALGHRLASDLPDPDEVRQQYRLTVPKLARSFADPLTESQYIDWELSKGKTDQIEELRKDYPTLDDEQLWKLLEQRLKNQARFNDEVTKRNLGMNANQDIQTAAQAFGATGPVVRDGKSTPPDGSRGNDERNERSAGRREQQRDDE